MEKRSIMAGLGDFYSSFPTGLEALPFVYNNINALISGLSLTNWKTYTPLLDVMANVKTIKKRLVEAIQSGQQDQWLLFYFTGHASKYYLAPNADPVTFCVTYYENLTEGAYPSLGNFFSGGDYEEIVETFGKHAPQGHLITIIDCCYANGLISDFTDSADFHTVIAATAENFRALYDDNSVFFKEFKKVLKQPLNKMQRLINSRLQQQHIPEKCIVRPAANFEKSTL